MRYIYLSLILMINANIWGRLPGIIIVIPTPTQTVTVTVTPTPYAGTPTATPTYIIWTADKEREAVRDITGWEWQVDHWIDRRVGGLISHTITPAELQAALKGYNPVERYKKIYTKDLKLKK